MELELRGRKCRTVSETGGWPTENRNQTDKLQDIA